MDDGEGIWNLMESDEHELAVPVQSSGAVEEEGGTFKTGAMRFLLDISISKCRGALQEMSKGRCVQGSAPESGPVLCRVQSSGEVSELSRAGDRGNRRL